MLQKFIFNSSNRFSDYLIKFQQQPKSAKVSILIKKDSHYLSTGYHDPILWQSPLNMINLVCEAFSIVCRNE